MMLCVCLCLILGGQEIKVMGLEMCIPKRKHKGNARSLASLQNRDMNSWDFSEVVITDWSKREMMAIMIQVAVLALIRSKC